MKIWWVLAGDHYYPNVDNFRISFATEKEAEEYVWNEKQHDHAKDWYQIVNVKGRL